MKTQRISFRLSWIAFRLLLMLVVLAAQEESFAADIYVSVDGDTQADGSLAKPYRSLPVAVEAARALRMAGNTEPVKIFLREGRHQLNQTLVLGREDGSPSDAQVLSLPKYGAGESSGPAYLTFAAYPGENPVVSAGVPVTGWKRLASAPAELPAKAAGKVWVADIPTGLDRFYTLYDAQGRLNRARGDGFLPTQNGNSRTLHFPEGALKNWDNLEDVEIQVRPSRAWVINMLPLVSVDEATGVAQTSVSATYGMGALPPYLLAIMGDAAASVWVENVLEELDEPGQWVVNTKTRKIYLWPSDPAPDGSPRGILAPATTELIRVEGQIDYEGPTDTPVQGIAFSGLTFSHADRWAWTSDEGRVGWGMQHDWDMFDRPTALLRFRGAEDCRVTDCKFVNSGGSGVRLDLHAQRNRITNCELAHLGEAGILLAGYGPGTKDVNHHNDIINNTIHHFSEITWHSPGLWAWQSGHNRMVHNELHHSGYSAVLITTRVEPDRSLNGEGGRTVRRHEITAEDKNRRRGGYESWKTREKYNHSRHNLFEYNEISHSVQLLSDGNAIYVSGTGIGNIIRYNYLHHNQAHSLPAAIRCDDDQHETLIYGNVLYKNRGHAAAIASKGTNDIINNFIVAQTAAPRWGYISFEWAPVTGSKVERNIVISHPEGGNAYAERLRRGSRTGGPKLVETDMNKNLYYHPTDSHWMCEHLLKMQAVGKEKASGFGDPLFVDPASGDFSFRPGSPALALGIEPLDVSKMGRLDDDSLIQLRPDGVTAIIASSGALSGNAKRHFRSANVVHGFSSPQDTVTWTVNVPKDDDYVVGVLFSKREQAQLEVTSGDSVLTAPSMIRTWEYRPFFWRQELPGTLHLKAGENRITFRLPDAKPTTASAVNRTRRSPRFGQGVTEEFHLFSIELGTAAARKAEVQRAKAIRGDVSWMIVGKYGIFVHWSAQSRGFTIDEKRAQWFQKSVEIFDVKVFADAIERTGAGWVTFTATHQGFYWPAPNAAIDKISPGRTAKRDLLGEIINELDKRGIRTLFYLHTGYNGYDPVVWREALGAKDADTQRFSDNIEAILRECSLRYGEKLMGFGYMDGALAWDYPLNPSWEGWARAIKAGNPKAVVGLSTNRGPAVSPFSELAVTDGGSELRRPDPQLIGPGQQLGDVTPAWWCLMDRGGWFVNRPMNGRWGPGPVHSTEEYVDFFKRMAGAKIPVTINLLMTADVTDEHPIFNPECMAVMEEVRKAIHGK